METVVNGIVLGCAGFLTIEAHYLEKQGVNDSMFPL